eukprot:scaffold185020_cov14-Tisochrysis_lutea.AAC.1
MDRQVKVALRAGLTARACMKAGGHSHCRCRLVRSGKAAESSSARPSASASWMRELCLCGPVRQRNVACSFSYGLALYPM